MPILPTVSIVVPAYNHGHFLPECIESVLAQTYPEIELIVLDDGSTDATPEVLAGYGDRFHWETQENMGQSATLNKGWAKARGEILGYLSADDALRPGAVAEAVQVLLTRPELVATYSDFDLINDQSQVVRKINAPDFRREALLLDLVCQPGPGAFFRRIAWEKAGPWDVTLRQNPDLDFWLRLALSGDFVRIPQNLALFRVHEASQTFQRADPVRAQEPLTIVHRFLLRNDIPDWVRSSKSTLCSSAYLASSQLHFRAGRFMAGTRCVGAAVRRDPLKVFSLHGMRVIASALFGRILYRIRAVAAGGRL